MNTYTLNLKLCWLLALPLLTSCNAFLTKQTLQTNVYALEVKQSLTPLNKNNDNKTLLPTLIINTPKAGAGYNSNRMLYTRNAHQIEYFAHNEWVDTPANMLQSLLLIALESTGDFKAVTPKTSAIKTEFKLETQVLTLIQNFDSKPSSVDLHVRLSLVDNQTNQIIASQLFKERVMAKSDTPAGGVEAANEAVNTVLNKIKIFVKSAIINVKN